MESENSNIKSDEKQNLTLVLGVSGSGVNTFVDFIARNVTDLISEIVTNNQEDGAVEYIIADNTNHSQTKYPYEIYDYENRTIFYSFPEFSNADNPVEELSVSDSVKQVVSRAKFIKLIFVIEYGLIINYNKINDFRQLAIRVTTMIPDINKFKNSIAIIVSKVNVNETNDQIMNSISTFLNDFKNNQAYSNNNTTHFLDILLTKTGNRYQNIGFMRQPTEIGHLSDMPEMIKQKITLETLVRTNIDFVKSEAKDFRDSVSEKEIIDTVQKTNSSLISSIEKELRMYFINKFEDIYDIGILKNTTKLEYEMFSEVKKMFKNSTNTTECMEIIVDGIVKITKKSVGHKFTIGENVLSNIKMSENSLDLLNKKLNISTDHLTECTETFANIIVEELDNSQKWYSYLYGLYFKLSRYEIQKNVLQWKSYANAKIEKANHNLNKKIKNTDLLQFFNTIDSEVYNPIREVKIDKTKLNHLNKVIQFTLNHNTNIYCSETDKVVVKGKYVKFSDLANLTCAKPIRSVEVIALDTVFVDKDLIMNSTNSLHMTIIAPIWDILDQYTITMDGKAAEPINKTHADDGLPETNGNNGTHGLPGEPGGIFLGIGETFKNSQYLTINVNGGDGGPGQDGGRGGDGRNGTSPKHRDTNYKEIIENCHGDGGKWKGFDCIRHNLSCSSGIFSSNSCKSNYTIYGGPGQEGMAGGNGGCGGIGGRPGKATIIGQQDLIMNFKKNANEGTVGACGTSGIGGQGGLSGNMLNLGYETKFNAKQIKLIDEYSVSYEKINTSNAPGKNGSCAICNYSVQDAAENNKLPKAISDYKIYLSENINNSIKQSSLETFSSLLENNPIINDV